MRKLKVFLIMGLFTFLITGCGNSSNDKGKKVQDVVFEYIANESKDQPRYIVENSNVRVSEDEGRYFVQLSKQGFSGRRDFIIKDYYEVLKHKDESVTVSDVKEIYNENDFDFSLPVIYEKNDIKLNGE